MAVARAPQRGGGVSAIHIWLIVFVALWLVSTVLLVWLYTDQSGLLKTADDLRLTNTDLETKQREGETARTTLAEFAVGSGGDDVGAVQGKVQELLGRIRADAIVPEPSAFEDASGGLLTAMTSLYEAFRGEHDRRTTAEADVVRLTGEMERLASDDAKRQESFEAKEKELVERVDSLENDLAQYRGDRDAEVDAFEGRIEELRQQFARDIQEQRQANTTLKQELAEYKTRYDDLQGRFGELQIKPVSLVTARQGDGVIVTAKPGDDVVYVNLGEEHQVTRGMQFAVYSSDTGIPESGQAKARIEVARVFPETCECTIRETLGRERILEGDIVNNPIYERGRSLTFVVAGTFDFGASSDEPKGPEHVEALIREWGGRVVETVSAGVDFVVLGTAPPRPPEAGQLSPEANERQAAARKIYDRYAAILDTAQAMSIPVLTQEVFLHFLGYSGQG